MANEVLLEERVSQQFEVLGIPEICSCQKYFPARKYFGTYTLLLVQPPVMFAQTCCVTSTTENKSEISKLVLMFHHLQGYVNVVLLFAADRVAADLAVLKTHQLMTAKVASLVTMIIRLNTMIIMIISLITMIISLITMIISLITMIISLITMIISLITMIIDSNNIYTWTELRPII